MNKSLSELLERMRTSREAVAQQLNLLSVGARSRAVAGKRMTITSKQIEVGLGVILALRFLFPVRRRRENYRS